MIRFWWAVGTVVLLECILLGLSLTPAFAFLEWHRSWSAPVTVRIAVLALLVVPLYALFGLLLAVTSALATRLLGWRTPTGLSMQLTNFDWPVLDWGRYQMTIHVVRVFAGPAFRSTPVWSWYLRLNGARIGRRVWVNSLAVMDHNLLFLDDEVVIGSDVHLAAHIVEHGLVKTAPVHLGARTVIGTGSVIGIGVTTGHGTHVGALSVVPKHATLEPDTAYAGAPVHRLG